ncbi:MAG: carbohydrate kinase family protein [Anaerolineae bacterium]|nr:carbohydrate kinase family protein [Anaerolineae bacterium]
MSKPHVVIGSTTVDLYISGIDRMPHIDGDEFTVSSLAWCSQPLTMTCGGNGANSAYVLAALGAPVTLVSAVGDDLLGQTITGWLTAVGVADRAILKRAGYGTSTTTALHDGHGNRLSFHHPGPLPDLHYADFPESIFSDAASLLITGYPLMRGFRPAGYLAALKATHAGGGLTALDIGPAIGDPVTVDELRPYFPHLDYLITNDYELGMCTGLDQIEAAVEVLLTAGANRVLVKRGRDGATAYAPDQAPLHVAAFPVEATVTIGAGDSFNAGLLYALVEGRPLEQAIQIAHATAGQVVASGRSVLGAPTFAGVQSFLGARGVHL